MAEKTFSKCTNCENTTNGDTIYECDNCRQRLCSSCLKSKCPGCGTDLYGWVSNNYTKIGKIEKSNR